MNPIISGISAVQPKQSTSDEKPLLPFTNSQKRELRPQTRVKIDKAKKLLHYQPRFNLEQGMKLTELWAKYANLV